MGQLSLPPGRVEILVRKPITPGGLLLARRQTELAKWVILKETCFSYDVSDNKRRRKIARLLEDAATRVQYSVFEATLDKARTDSLGQCIAALLGEGDSLRVYVIGADGRARSRVYGDAAPFESEEGYWLL